MVVAARAQHSVPVVVSPLTDSEDHVEAHVEAAAMPGKVLAIALCEGKTTHMEYHLV